MKLLTKTHKIIVLTFVVISILAVLSLLWKYSPDSPEVLSETDFVTITAEVPHVITIKIKPESRIPPINNDSLPIVVEVRQEGTTIPIATYSIIAANTGDAFLGTISINDIPLGTYDIAIKGLSHLRKVFTHQSFEGPSIRTYTLTIPELAAGDTNPTEDNYVNSLDISYMSMHLYESDQRADLTNDGIINSLDYSALLKNLYSHGDD